jgi:hypothetical protein
MVDDRAFEMLNTNVENLQNEVRSGFKSVNEKLDGMVDKELCKTFRSTCNNKQEWSIKKITAVSGAIAAVGSILIGLAKILFGG